MCELLGVSVAPAARLGVYFHEFRPRAEENREGWGIAWWEDGHAEIRKEPIPAHESALAARLADEHPASEMFIVHVRAATVGDLTEANAHPWSSEALGRQWVFAHNGTVRDLDRLDLGRFVQEGETDSERAFHHLLTRMEHLGAGASDERLLAAEILAAGRELSERDSRVNFLLSDGVTLYAYHDGHKTLHVLEKHAADLGEIAMDDDDYRLALRLGDAADEHAVVVASVPLTEEPGWEKLDAGAFVVVRAGRITRRVPPGGAL
ncbi:MAG: hypothetical protein FJW95_05215 [Actinobacteria bacterium]|nr:hypothetical protein [Actinomycetota bacterium]